MATPISTSLLTDLARDMTRKVWGRSPLDQQLEQELLLRSRLWTPRTSPQDPSSGQQWITTNVTKPRWSVSPPKLSGMATDFYYGDNNPHIGTKEAPVKLTDKWRCTEIALMAGSTNHRYTLETDDETIYIEADPRKYKLGTEYWLDLMSDDDDD